MSAPGTVHPKMYCPECKRLVAYSDDKAGYRWLRRHGPREERCPISRMGSIVMFYQLWVDKGLIPGKGPEAAR